MRTISTFSRFLTSISCRGFRQLPGILLFRSFGTSYPCSATDSPKMAQSDILEQILHDHQEMRGFCKKIDSLNADKEEATKWLHQLVWEVARHSVAEELVLYPLMERELGADGKRMADDSREDHQRTKDDLQFLEDKSLTDIAAQARYKKMADELLIHLKKEEDEDLTQVRLHIDKEKLQDAGKDFKRRKYFAPTRPHPENSMNPLFETPYSMLVMPLDKLRDLFRKFPDHDDVEEVEKKATGRS